MTQNEKAHLMRVLRVALVFVILIPITVPSAAINAGSMKWMCASEIKAKYNDADLSPIVEQNNESLDVKVIIGHDGRVSEILNTGKALIIYSLPYMEVLSGLRRIVTVQFGEARHEENKSASFLDNYMEKFEISNESDRINYEIRRKTTVPLVTKARAILKPVDLKVEGFTQTTVVSKAYHKSDNRSSKLTLRVIDGHSLAGVTGTFVIATRLDQAKEFGWYGHSPLPRYYSREWDLVTGTEFAVFAAFARRYGVPLKFLSIHPDLAIKSTDSWITAVRWLKSQHTASPEPGSPLEVPVCDARSDANEKTFTDPKD